MVALEHVLSTLNRTGHLFYFKTYSALDRYFQKKSPHIYFFLTDAPLQLFASLFEEVTYFKTAETDVLVQVDSQYLFFQCVENLAAIPQNPFAVLNLYYDFNSDSFLDPFAAYPWLRQHQLKLPPQGLRSFQELTDLALLISQYQYTLTEEVVIPDFLRPLSLAEQRLFLMMLLSAECPAQGLTLLKQTGFIDQFWPELSPMSLIQQTKDHHPEGDVWLHVLEALKYRKKNDLLLSFAILLHDLGKTVVAGTRDKPYADHAHHGAILAERFLRRLEFPTSFVQAVSFLIRNHMMPEALPKMPLYRIEKLLRHELFPTLLELYRADLLATFQGPQKYYTACNLYRSFLKTSSNPFRVLKPQKRLNEASRA